MLIRNFIFLFAAVVIAPAATAGEAGTVGAVVPRENYSGENTERETKSFSLMGLDGARHSLSDWKGKVVILNFWASWCSPCLSEIHHLVAFQERYQSRGLQVIGVGLDDEKKLRNVQRTLEINYPVLVADPVKNSGLMTQWGNSSGTVPYTVVIDRDGRVAYVHRGLMNGEVFDEYVLPLLVKSE